RPGRPVRGRRPDRRAQPQRVVRPGRAGGPGVRYPGRGGRGRRAGHRRPRRRVRGPGRRSRPGPLGACPRRSARLPGPPRSAVHRRRRARPELLLDAHGLWSTGGVPRRPRRPVGAPRPPGSGLVTGLSEVVKLIEGVLADRELAWERTGDLSLAVVLPGTHKLKTTCNLIVGEHAL